MTRKIWDIIILKLGFVAGKKGKKTKGKTLNLTDFLQQSPGSAPTVPIRKTTNWADEEVDELGEVQFCFFFMLFDLDYTT